MSKAGYECAAEGENFWAKKPNEVPLTTFESIVIYTCLTITSIASLAIIAGATGWIYQTFFN